MNAGLDVSPTPSFGVILLISLADDNARRRDLRIWYHVNINSKLEENAYSSLYRYFGQNLVNAVNSGQVSQARLTVSISLGLCSKIISLLCRIWRLVFLQPGIYWVKIPASRLSTSTPGMLVKVNTLTCPETTPVLFARLVLHRRSCSRTPMALSL